jgi:hypothetical protein
MGTKQIKMEFQVVANNQTSANVTITMGGTQVFSGALAQTTATMPSKVLDDQTPYALVEFDLEVENIPTVAPFPESDQYCEYTTPMDVTIAVTGGDITLQATEANYNCEGIPPIVPTPTSPPFVQVLPGDAATFTELRFYSQPVWTPTPTTTGRLDIADNVDTGPGSLLLLDNESVAYQVSMTLYSA